MAAELKPVYLIAGTDRPKIDTALRRLRAHFGPDAMETHLAVETAGDDVTAACNALGLFADEGRLIVVDGVHAWKAADAKAIDAYLQSPAPATVLALVGDEVKKDSALAKACAKAGDVLVYQAPRDRDLPGWVAKQFEALATPVEQDACRALVELAGDDLRELTSEIEKIAQWAGGDTVTEADVRLLASALAETAGFELTDAWGRRDLAAALGAAEEILERSSKPRRDEAARLAGMLTSHVDRIRACQTLEAEGVSSKDAATKMKRHPFYVQKLYAQARNFSAEELRDATVRLAQLDLALKGGSRLAPDLELERALVDLTRAAG